MDGSYALAGVVPGFRPVKGGVALGFPVTTHAWVASQVPRWECAIDVSLPFLLPLFPSLYK